MTSKYIAISGHGETSAASVWKILKHPFVRYVRCFTTHRSPAVEVEKTTNPVGHLKMGKEDPRVWTKGTIDYLSK